MLSVWSRRAAGAVAVAALSLGSGSAADPLTPPPVIPTGLASEPAGPVLDVTPPSIPGGHHTGHGLPHTTVCPPGEKWEEKKERPAGFFGSAELIFWRPRFADTAFALRDPTFDLTPSGRIEDINPDTRLGLRVGGGYRLESGWGVGLLYTYLESNDGSAIAAPAGGVIYPTLTRPGIVDRAATAAADAGLTYQLFDLDVSKTVELDKHLALRTFAGVRFANIDSDLNAGYDGQLARQARVASTSEFVGAGPTAGAEATWEAGPIGLFGAARGGLVYGRFDSRLTEVNANGTVPLADVSDRAFGLAPTMTVQLGGSYNWRGLSVAAGYEVTHWFGAVSRPTFTDDFADGRVARKRSDLSLDGVFVRLMASY
jgi:hypothetical protein